MIIELPEPLDECPDYWQRYIGILRNRDLIPVEGIHGKIPMFNATLDHNILEFETEEDFLVFKLKYI